MEIFDADATRAALPFDALISALRTLFATGCEVPQRHVHAVDDSAGAQAGTLLLMPAWTPGGMLGVKTVAIFASNAARKLPALHSTYLLHDARTGVPLALIDGDEITSRRTAAASALAASYLAPAHARRLLVVGAGRVARLLPEAYAAVRPIDRIDVWARRPEAARALAEALQRDGFAAQAAGDLAEAAHAADIVSCATLATEPVVRGSWLRPGSHLDLIGSFTPAMREADDACFAGAGIFIDTPEALGKSGELLGPMARGVFTAADIAGTLEQLCRGECGAKRETGGPPSRTVFKSVGTALEDLAAAMLVVAPLAG